MHTVINLRGKTYAEIGAACGTSRSVAHRWLTGKAMPKQGNARLLAKALGIKPATLLLALYHKRHA